MKATKKGLSLAFDQWLRLKQHLPDLLHALGEGEEGHDVELAHNRKAYISKFKWDVVAGRGGGGRGGLAQEACTGGKGAADSCRTCSGRDSTVPLQCDQVSMAVATRHRTCTHQTFLACLWLGYSLWMKALAVCKVAN